MTKKAKPPMLFGESLSNRTINFLFRLSQDEKNYLRDEAKRRGIRTTTLVRECLRRQLFPDSQ